jgi:hypothetical protein
MLAFIRTLLFDIKSLVPFAALQPLVLTRLVEKFDVVERVPAYARIKVRFSEPLS